MEDSRFRSSPTRIYDDFQPLTEWIMDNNVEVLRVRIPGFSKNQLKVQIDNHGNLRITGERPVDPSPRWSRFQTVHRIPFNTDVAGIKARFDVDTLYITFPRLITEKPTNAEIPAPTPEPEPERKPAPPPEQEPKTAPLPGTEQKPSMPEQKQEPERKRKEEAKEKDAKNTAAEEKEAFGKEAKDREMRSVDKAEEKIAGKVATVPPQSKGGVDLMARFGRPRQVVVNIVAAVIVLVAIGIYASYKLRNSAMGKGESS